MLRSLSRRALVIGWLKGYVLFVANGCEWEPEIADFVRWSIAYDLHCKMTLFGEALHEEMTAETAAVSTRYRSATKPVLTQLPHSFGLAELTKLCDKVRTKLKPNQLINMWICRKLISEVSKERYTKTQKYNQIYKR